MKYLCVDLTGQCVVHVEDGPRRPILIERICGLNILTRARGEVTQGESENEE